VSYKQGTILQSVHCRAHKVCINYTDTTLHRTEKNSYIRTYKYIIPVASLHVVENITMEYLSGLKFELSEIF
jgi:hypothetical protein